MSNVRTIPFSFEHEDRGVVRGVIEFKSKQEGLYLKGAAFGADPVLYVQTTYAMVEIKDPVSVVCHGASVCSPTDTYRVAEGREHALKRALGTDPRMRVGLPLARDLRVGIWAAYRKATERDQAMAKKDAKRRRDAAAFGGLARAMVYG